MTYDMHKTEAHNILLEDPSRQRKNDKDCVISFVDTGTKCWVLGLNWYLEN